MLRGNKENIERLTSLGGAAAVVKVKNKWPDDGKVQTAVKSLTKLIVAGMSSLTALLSGHLILTLATAVAPPRLISSRCFPCRPS
jgi:hypothetical protein